MEKEPNLSEDLERLKIKEEKALRNKIKKTAQKLEKKQQQEQNELRLKIQQIGGNISLITQDFVDIIAKKQPVFNCNDIAHDETNFPTLGKPSRVPKKALGNVNSFIKDDGSSDKQVLSFGDFINPKPKELTVTKKVKSGNTVEPKYAGNPLDSDIPVRKKGKFREVPKPKRDSALKREINKDKAGYVESADAEKLCLSDVYPNVMITDEIDDAVRAFITRMVELQEKLFKRDSIKGKYKRRYVTGFHEAKKYLNLNKVKVIIIATDIKFIKPNDAMSCLINEIIESCQKNDVFYLFALKRRKLGVLTLKYIPVSCIAILNHEGAEEQLSNVILQQTEDKHG